MHAISPVVKFWKKEEKKASVCTSWNNAARVFQIHCLKDESMLWKLNLKKLSFLNIHYPFSFFLHSFCGAVYASASLPLSVPKQCGLKMKIERKRDTMYWKIFGEAISKLGEIDAHFPVLRWCCEGTSRKEGAWVGHRYQAEEVTWRIVKFIVVLNYCVTSSSVREEKEWKTWSR